MTIHEYLTQLRKRYQGGLAKEHAYRTDLEQLLRTLAPQMEITNEPAHVTDCGNPDFVVANGKIPVGYLEAKDIGKDLNSKQYHEQFSRYRKALDNLIITDYVWFQFFRHDALVHEIRLGEIRDGQIVPLPENFAYFTNLITEFCSFSGQTITSASKLAELMAAKARLLQNILEQALTADLHTPEQTALKDQLEAFRQILIHDLAPREFADLYAQTLAYGLFAARLHDPSLDTFTRLEAAELIPKTNPFLRKLFQYILLEDIDPRIKSTVDNLAEVFRAADVNALMHHFAQTTQQTDPVIHFYETFLAAYDPKLRKSRGVWYTPAPVVQFIVQAIDDLLHSEFELSQGLADTSTITMKVEEQGNAQPVKREVHKVQFLDPGVGTGTFLVEVVRRIYATRFETMPGTWSAYVEEHLLPRLNGFELLMAPYTMAHLKLDLFLQKTHYQPKQPKRFNIYLTNSLEEYHPDTQSLLAHWLSAEANAASAIKRDAPIMVVMGNPPYAVSSANASINTAGEKTWIGKLLDDYKKDLDEKKLNLDDDYIKFIRYGHYLIEKNGEGILAYISNNSFLDGVTHRQMRKTLLETFDAIYILDLHGSAKKKETAPDGGKDENVFDIMQGVSINFFVKTTKKKKARLADVFHADVYGRRKEKYAFLLKEKITTIQWQKLDYQEPYFFFVPKDFSLQGKYDEGINVTELFRVYGNGIGTDRDRLFYDDNKPSLIGRMELFFSDECFTPKFQEAYNVKNSTSYNILGKRLKARFDENFIRNSLYRPFDNKHLYYDPQIISRPAFDTMRHLMNTENVALLITRQLSSQEFRHSFISKSICDRDPLSVATKERTQAFPLYFYPEGSAQQTFGLPQNRTPNLNMAIVQRIADTLGLRFVPEEELTPGSSQKGKKTFAPIDLLDYIYAVLHSPTYRATYKEFLKIDFPRVPYPTDVETFWQLVALGGELRQLHLLESPKVEKFIATYPQDGDHVVRKVWFDMSPEYPPSGSSPKKERSLLAQLWNIEEITPAEPGANYSPEERSAWGECGKVWINDRQYYAGVPQIAWEFYIGGYQPAQKWLKDRQGRELSFEELVHYQKIIVALTETERLMRAIDAVWRP